MKRSASFAILVLSSLLATPTVANPANSHPASVIAGKWHADAKISSPTGGDNNSGYWWVGRMWGVINDKGRLLFKADNNCIAEGVITSSDALGIIGSAKMTGCEETSLNRTYNVKIRTNGKTITIELFHTVYVPTTMTYSTIGTFVRY